MKKVLIVAATAGLMSLAACGGPAPTTNDVAANMADNYEAMADNFEAMADNATNATTEATLENAASAAEEKADALGNAAQ